MAETLPATTGPLSPTGGYGPTLDRARAFAAQPAVRRALPWLAGVAGLGAMALAWTVLFPAPQRVLYAELDDSQRAGVTATLDKAGIGYQIDNATGQVTVGEDDVYRARMLVAADGALPTPQDQAASLEALPLGASRTLEGERLRGARERDLELTIKEIDGIEAVRVHLAEAERSVFVRENAPPSASVMVRLARGRQLGESQVAAIINLVAASVAGLSPDMVQVIDGHGRLLSERKDADSRRLELQAQLEAKLRGQLDQLLTPMLGPGNFTSEVQVELDMDETTSARESYDKQGVVRSETQSQSQSQSSGAGGAIGVPGVLSNTPPPAATPSPGPPGSSPSPAPTGTNGESSATRTYELGREVAVSTARPGKVRRLSVAVALSATAMKKAKPADVAQIKQLVSAAVGADPARGDQVEVVTRAFDSQAIEAPPFYEAAWFSTLLRYALALAGVLLVLLLVVRPLLAAVNRAVDRIGGADASGEDSADSEDAADPGSLAAANEADPALLAQHVKQLVEAKPDDAAEALRQLLRTPPPAGGPAT